ncbi:MAG: ribosomal-processing cysteine protease Prp [Solobacterium sp.]|nr:ribosomal-processing cysteine protease Prp [Solobacterium sp.]
MIRVNCSVKDGHIVHLKAKGHAEAGPYGEDLVCAGVSSILFGLCNALDESAGIETIEADQNLITVNILKPDQTTDTIMRTGLIQLMTVEEQYSQFMKIQLTEE